MKYLLLTLIISILLSVNAQAEFKSMVLPVKYQNPEQIKDIIYTHRFVIRDDSLKGIVYYRKKFNEVFGERYLAANRFAGVVVVYLNAIAGDKELFENIVRSPK